MRCAKRHGAAGQNVKLGDASVGGVQGVLWANCITKEGQLGQVLDNSGLNLGGKTQV